MRHLTLLLMLTALLAACGGAPSATSTPRPPTPTPLSAAQASPQGSPAGAPQATGTASGGLSVNPPATTIAGPDGRNTTLHNQQVYIDLYVDGAPHGYLGVNFRSQPTLASPVYSVIENGQKVQANARGTTDAQGRAWYQVQYGGRTGYVVGELLALNEPQPAQTVQYYVDATFEGFEGANLRSEASRNNPPVNAQLANGDVLTGLATPVKDELGRFWYNVKIGGKFGFVLGSLLNTDPPKDTLTLFANAAPQGAQSSNLRERPSMQAKVIGWVPNGAVVEAYPEDLRGEDGQKGWRKVTYGGTSGYMRLSLLTRDNPLARTTAYVSTSGSAGATARLWERPDAASNVLFDLEPGTEVQAYPQEFPGKGELGGWRKVVYKDVTGYMQVDTLVAEKPASPSSSDVLINSNTHYGDGRVLHVVGDVRNRSGRAVSSVRIAVNFYNEAGDKVYSADGASSVPVIAPGALSPFHLVTYPPTGWSHYAFEITSAASTAAPLAGIEVVYDSTYVEAGRYHVVGQVRNSTGRALSSLVVIAALDNGTGMVLDVADGSPTPDSLAPGARAMFDIAFPADRSGAPYTLYFRARE